MRYISTRGLAPTLGFSDAVLAGLARDGGLYWPERFPVLDKDVIAGFAGRSYQEIAQAVISPFADDIAPKDLERMIGEAYAGFRHQVVCPVVQTRDNQFVLELFHGPTLAFKDVAMQLLGRLMDHISSSATNAPPLSARRRAIQGGRRSRRFRVLSKSMCLFSTRMGG